VSLFGCSFFFEQLLFDYLLVLVLESGVLLGKLIALALLLFDHDLTLSDNFLEAELGGSTIRGRSHALL